MAMNKRRRTPARGAARAGVAQAHAGHAGGSRPYNLSSTTALVIELDLGVVAMRDRA